MKKCKNCKAEFTPIRFNQKFCLEEPCIKVWVNSQKEKEWKVVRLSRNYGQIPAILAGLQLTDADQPVVVMSADLQDPPILINKFIEKWLEGYKIVIGIKESSDENKVMFRKRMCF